MKASLLKATAMLLAFIPLAAGADYSLDQGPILATGAQDLVVSFSRDLGDLSKNGRLKNLDESSIEQACLALTLAQSSGVSMDDLR